MRWVTSGSALLKALSLRDQLAGLGPKSFKIPVSPSLCHPAPAAGGLQDMGVSFTAGPGEKNPAGSSPSRPVWCFYLKV